MLEWLRILTSIVLVDLVLSGDNALVIGAVAANMRAGLRWLAFVAGGGGAIVLRIVLTYCLTLLLQVPYLELLGGVLLLLITSQLLMSKSDTPPAKDEQTSQALQHERPPLGFLKKNRILGPIISVLAADLSTSLDNIVAIAALARENTTLLVIGLLLSILVLLVGSALIARLIRHFPWVILIVGITLTFASAQLMAQDDHLSRFFHDSPWWTIGIYLAALTVMIYPIYRWFRNYPDFMPRIFVRRND